MKCTLGDLNLHLFAQLERLSSEKLKGETLKEEINKAKAIGDIAAKIIDNGSLVLQAKKWHDGRWDADDKLPQMLEGSKLLEDDKAGKK